MAKDQDDTEFGAVQYDEEAVVGVPGVASDVTAFVEVPEGVHAGDFARALVLAAGEGDEQHVVVAKDSGFEVPEWVLDKAVLPEAADYADEGDDDETLKELDDLTVAKLHKLAKDKGIDLNGARSKPDIIAKIKDAEAAND